MNEVIVPPKARTSGGVKVERSERSHSRRNALLCALLVGVCALATYPVAEMGIVDDWSYSKTALDFARTGHFHFYGWSAPMLGWQVLWGALFIKLFGFSFTVLRLSILLVALATVFLFHQILIRFQIAPRLAVFGALTLGLSPLFLPLACCFLSDVPGLLVILLCIYMCQRAVAAKSDRFAVLWLCSAALVNVGGGTVRQIAWLGVLVMVPSTAWLLRGRRGIVPAAIASWAASAVAIFGLIHWYNRQPYIMSEGAFTSQPLPTEWFVHLTVLMVRALLWLLLILLSVIAGWLPTASKLSRRAWARIAVCMLAIVAAYCFLGIHGKLEGNIMPWIKVGNSSLGIVPSRSVYMLGSMPVVLGIRMRVVLSLIVIATGLILAEKAFAGRGSLTAFLREEGPSSWRTIVWILGPFALSYLCMLLPRSIHGFFFDKYFLPFIPMAVLVLLKLYQQHAGGKPATISWAVLAVFSLYTVAATHDWFAMYRAQAFAANEIVASGIPRTEIQGEFEYNGWTQIQNGGHINLPYILVPKGAYNPNVPPLPLEPDCQLPNSNWTPAVRPKYFLTFDQMVCLAPSEYPAVVYRAWLPPFHRRIYVQQSPIHSN